MQKWCNMWARRPDLLSEEYREGFEERGWFSPCLGKWTFFSLCTWQFDFMCSSPVSLLWRTKTFELWARCWEHDENAKMCYRMALLLWSGGFRWSSRHWNGILEDLTLHFKRIMEQHCISFSITDCGFLFGLYHLIIGFCVLFPLEILLLSPLKLLCFKKNNRDVRDIFWGVGESGVCLKKGDVKKIKQRYQLCRTNDTFQSRVEELYNYMKCSILY